MRLVCFKLNMRSSLNKDIIIIIMTPRQIAIPEYQAPSSRMKPVHVVQIYMVPVARVILT